MRQLNVRLTTEQYSAIKTTVETLRPRCSLQAWVADILERATQPAPACPADTIHDDFTPPWEETTLPE